MSTIIYPSPIFGPVRSRRLGVSLGINLLPGDGKWCTFDCLYCECGLNEERRTKSPLPTRCEVSDALKRQLARMHEEGPRPDVLTFAGNGEPTLHPAFPEIVEDTIRLRDQFCPEAQISVLSNSTQIHRPRVREALLRTDNPIMKLDTVSADFIRLMDRPQGHYDVENIIAHLAEMSPKVIIQTMFLNATSDSSLTVGTNTGDEYVLPWLEAVKQIQPRQVMIYTVDRETPVLGLEKASREVLDGIAERVRQMGIDCSVSY
ncbi:MAG: radical SAM protein [Bacteroidaceae bacterium]|nr:radical SAM protein [Bacteroidaceae bacterium]